MPILAQSSITQSLSEGLATFARVLPTILMFLLILVVGYFIAKALSRILDRVLERVGFDQAVQRGGLQKALQRSNYDPSDILAKIVFYAIMLFVLQLAFGLFGPNPISGLIFSVIAFLPKLFVAILIVVIAAAIAAAVKEVVEASLGGLSYGRVLAGVASGAVLVIGAFAALDQLGIAETITNTLFIAIVAIFAGSAIIAIGGGGVAPMRQQWERALARVEEEAPQVREQAQGSADRVSERAQERQRQASGQDSGEEYSRDPQAGGSRRQRNRRGSGDTETRRLS